MSTDDYPREMFRDLPWPFPDGAFPRQLGAVVMRTVLDGALPALQVVHLPDNSWAVADGVTDPNADGACVATHIWHVVVQNTSMLELAALPPGMVADRAAVGEPWTWSEFRPEDEPNE